jgi:hypothetical protein
MLNALLGKKILGSNVVPETANLTIINYSKTPSASVVYWNKKEWQRLENSALQIDEMKEFIQETKNTFGSKIDDFICQDSLSQDININNLSLYTSAVKSQKKSNLIKNVNLNYNLDFLKNGVSIVDTPGLDDIVILREEITKRYINNCDLLIHLMNVSQSATLVDIEFLIDCILYQNITQILIIITRADLVSKEQLNEVIEYTKISIKTQLKLLNKDNSLDFILDKIKFIPISAKMALYHRTNKADEALKLGFSLEDTNILKIESYLKNLLFDKNSSKGQILIRGTKLKLTQSINSEIKNLNHRLTLYLKSKDELHRYLIDFENKTNKNKKILSNIKNDINIYKNNIKNEISILSLFLKDELLQLQDITRQRVFDDVKYSLEKTKKLPQNSRIKIIIQTAIKDGTIDIIRDYRYKLLLKFQNINETFNNTYEEFSQTIVLDDSFKSGFLTSTNKLLISKILKYMAKCKKNTLIEFNKNIKIVLEDEFKPITNNIKQEISNNIQNLTDIFFINLNNPVQKFEQTIKSNQNNINEQIHFLKNKKNKDKEILSIHKKIKQLENIGTVNLTV